MQVVLQKKPVGEYVAVKTLRELKEPRLNRNWELYSACTVIGSQGPGAQKPQMVSPCIHDNLMAHTILYSTQLYSTRLDSTLLYWPEAQQPENSPKRKEMRQKL